jgi:hypothetical protein
MKKSDAINSPDFAAFLSGYTTALLWSSADTVDGDDVNLDDYELSTAGADKCRAGCLDFFTANHADIVEAAGLYPTRKEHGGFALAGHDFALTRNGHGAGFWDGDLPEELGERLTKASDAAGQVDAYLGDDGQVWL